MEGGFRVSGNSRDWAVATPPIMLGKSIWTLACLVVRVDESVPPFVKAYFGKKTK
jgi:hypothetical protein